MLDHSHVERLHAHMDSTLKRYGEPNSGTLRVSVVERPRRPPGPERWSSSTHRRSPPMVGDPIDYSPPSRYTLFAVSPISSGEPLAMIFP